MVRGSVRGLDGKAIAGAVVNVWQADAGGHYDVQHAEVGSAQGRGVLHSDADGGFNFNTVVAEAYPIPTDGPVGALLDAAARHPWRPAHLHLKIEAPGYEPLVTHAFREGDQWLDSDAVFGVRQSLVAKWTLRPNGFYALEYDFVLNPKDAVEHAAGKDRRSSDWSGYATPASPPT